MRKPPPNDPRAMLQSAMTAHGVSQHELARRTGIHQPSISDFLTGKADVTTDTYARLLAGCVGKARKG